MLVLLPTRRACRSLREAFVRQAGGQALLLPRIQPIGEVEADELLLAGAIDLALPPAISALRRQLLLARLLTAVDRPPGACAAPCRRACACCSTSCRPSGCRSQRSTALVPDELAEHWQASRAVLGVIAEAWPAAAGRGRRARSGRAPPPPADQPRRALAARAAGAADRRGGLDRQHSRHPRAAAGDRRPAARHGRAAGPRSRRSTRRPGGSSSAGHPQYGLKQLLDALEVERAKVPDWPAPGARRQPIRRGALLLREVMRPAATIGAWHEQTIAAGSDREASSRGISRPRRARRWRLRVRMRGALEQPGRTAALVTPDRHLARRVAVELRRWQIEVDDSAGTPLDQTPPGAFSAADRAPDRRWRRAGDPARDPEASAGPGGMSPAPSGSGRASWSLPACAARASPAALRACSRSCAASGSASAQARQADRLGRGPAGSGPAVRRAGRARRRPTSPRLVRAHLAFAESLARDAKGQRERAVEPRGGRGGRGASAPSCWRSGRSPGR